MQRRRFLQLSVTASAALFFPSLSRGARLDLGQINFSSSLYETNGAQTIIVFLYGGASQLAGNLSNIDAVKSASQSSYDDYFGTITKTVNGFWQEAGGDSMEDLIANGDMTVFRTCYSAVREAEDNKAHGICVQQNQKGRFDLDSAGALTNLGLILQHHGMINGDTNIPFVTMNGESNFYAPGALPIAGYLKPMGIDRHFDNPYKRESTRRWFYYTETERESAPDSYWKDDDQGGFEPAFNRTMDQVAQQHNRPGKIKTAFDKRRRLSAFIDGVAQAQVPDLGADAYDTNNEFAVRMRSAVTLMVTNPDTKVLTIGTGGLGNWDDHDNARSYVRRMHDTFRALKSAVAHLKAENKDGRINIMVFGDFGRNVNLNSAHGWDHGNLQNFYVLCGKDYFNHQGVVGETVVRGSGKFNRLFMYPKDGSYWFEPLSIAATLYKIYGIENPEVLTGGYGAIDPLFS